MNRATSFRAILLPGNLGEPTVSTGTAKASFAATTAALTDKIWEECLESKKSQEAQGSAEIYEFADYAHDTVSTPVTYGTHTPDGHDGEVSNCGGDSRLRGGIVPNLVKLTGTPPRLSKTVP